MVQDTPAQVICQKNYSTICVIVKVFGWVPVPYSWRPRRGLASSWYNLPHPGQLSNLFLIFCEPLRNGAADAQNDGQTTENGCVAKIQKQTAADEQNIFPGFHISISQNSTRPFGCISNQLWIIKPMPLSLHSNGQQSAGSSSVLFSKSRTALSFFILHNG